MFQILFIKEHKEGVGSTETHVRVHEHKGRGLLVQLGHEEKGLNGAREGPQTYCP